MPLVSLMKKIIPYLILPTILGIAFLSLALTISQASTTMNLLLIISLVLSVFISSCLVRWLPLRPYALSVVSCFILYLVWSLLWASAEESYIFLTQSQHGPEGRYIYPGHSGMGYAGGFLQYFENLPLILILSTITGLFNLSITYPILLKRTLGKVDTLDK